MPNLEDVVAERHRLFGRKNLLERVGHGAAVLAVDESVGRGLPVRTPAERKNVGLGVVFCGVHIRLIAGKVVVAQI